MLASAAGTSGLRAHLLLNRVLGRYRVERMALKRGSGFLHRLAGILPFCSDTVCVCVGRHCGSSLGVCAEAAHGEGTKTVNGASQVSPGPHARWPACPPSRPHAYTQKYTFSQGPSFESYLEWRVTQVCVKREGETERKRGRERKRETIKSWMPRASGGLGHREGRVVGRIGGGDGLDPVGQLAQRSGVVFVLSSLAGDQVFHALRQHSQSQCPRTFAT
jgi:hypothetical protein